MLNFETNLESSLPGAQIFTEDSTSGLLAGTRIATNVGWRPVEALAEGDQVLTFDGGLKTLVRVDRTVNWMSDAPCPESAAPLAVPAGLLGNQEPMYVLPQQGIVVESDLAEERTGDPFAVIPAGALRGLLGVKPVTPASPHAVIHLVFKEDQIVFAGNGALILCSTATGVLDQILAGPDAPYAILSGAEAENITEDFVMARKMAA